MGIFTGNGYGKGGVGGDTGKGNWFDFRNALDPFGLGIWGPTRKTELEMNAKKDLEKASQPGSDPLKAELDRQAQQTSQIQMRDQDRQNQLQKQRAYGARGTVLTGPLGDYKGETNKTVLGS
jgi:hypothetical protein